ncbi:MAG: acyltransferase [Phyllobacteriaceae bacterium]|jgi:peptidoglycan/LPS O-acetylase OafA/YrhL|nr:acyltransferase [Phyllobacteriaceae bacterium]
MVHVHSSADAADRRIPALDGVRGFMTIAVVVSHYFAEVPSGIPALMFGWLAVNMFYVLSGFLIARLILNKGVHENFFKVFYIRRVCRTFPIYFACVFLIFAITALWPMHNTFEGTTFPLHAYLTFTQNIWMAQTGSIGQHWLAPTWTLALEEQFYLIAPALILFTPRRHLASVLIAMCAFAVFARGWVLLYSDLHEYWAAVLLPTRLDVLAMGVLAALLLHMPKIDWSKWDLWLRAAPLPLLVIPMLLKLLMGDDSVLFKITSPLFVSAACASFLMALARGAPEAKNMQNRVYDFFCTISYAVYLTHLIVLGLMHNIILGVAPDIASPQQIAVTLAAIPVTVAVSWILTRYVEMPITNYGRSFKWSKELRQFDTKTATA